MIFFDNKQHLSFIKKNMIFNYNGIKIFYEYKKGVERPFVFLHGWGRNCDDFKEFASKFPNKGYLFLDFPPFGQSDRDVGSWSIFNYVSMVISLCDKLGIESCDIVAHSFGGRVAIILSAVKRAFVHSCILIDSAGMKPHRSIKFRYKVAKYKLYKKLGKNVDNFGSSDYRNMSRELKKLFNNIVNTHLESYARQMRVKTLIVFGKNDDQTPLYMAKRLNKLIKNSTLKIIGGTHFSFLDSPLEFYSIVVDFLGE